MKNKYYTPTKEEFHVGFEYEAKPKRSEYVDYLGFIWEGENSLKALFHTSSVRVKYLDKNDIEDLGFKQLDRVNKRRYIKDNISIWLGDITKGILTKIEVRDELRTVGTTKSFIGDVKNKSELKRLLKQLNIL